MPPLFMALNQDFQDDDDEREAQAHKDFDSLFYDIDESITKFELERPQLFNEQPDHTTLTFYNKKSKEQEAAEKRDEVEDQKKLAASNLIQHLIDGFKLSSLKYKKTKAIEGEGGGRHNRPACGRI